MRKQQSKLAISIYFLFEVEVPTMSHGELNEAACMAGGFAKEATVKRETRFSSQF